MASSHSRARAAYSTAILVLLPLLSACSAGDTGASAPSSSPGAPQGRGEIHELKDSKALKLPLDDYLVSAADLTAIDEGHASAIARCLARMGAPQAPKVRRDPLVHGNERRYGLADTKLAEQSGYHLPSAARTGEKYPPSLMPVINGEVAEYNGTPVPEGGCGGEAQRELHGAEMQQTLGTAQRLNTEGFTKSRQDPAVTAVSAAWSKCMKESGHDYPDPTAAINDTEFRGAEPTDREKKVALADVQCKQKVNLIGVWAAAETVYQQQLIKENSAELEKGLAAKRATMSAAASAVSGAAAAS
ncbi:hypothetical protein [Streptomyces sp. NPDC096339]|uniref:hypothetical protein n=1 Tax=Streptomyces sp. NPDC096339 TaxID=3366086 RepID=UPI00382C23D5